MSESHAVREAVPAEPVELELDHRLRAFTSRDCTQDQFVDGVFSVLQRAPESAPAVLQFIDHHRQSGAISEALALFVGTKIASGSWAHVDYGTTIDLEADIDLQADIDLRAGSGKIPVPIAAAAAADPWRKSRIELGLVLRGRYVLETRLGSGGMGLVFKALDRYRCDLPQASQYVAVKILHDDSAGRAERLANLKREFHCAQNLSHPNVVKVYELDQDGEIDFFTMELLEGELLSGIMRRLQPEPMVRSNAWAIIEGIGAGLAHAHSRNIVHSDLKPHNILVTHAGEVRILDFGASANSRWQQIGQSPRPSSQSALTPAYASCELLAGRPADPSDDLYAFACLAYELLCGAHPFQRRPSTEARNLGILPRRIPDLSRQQWQALVAGLSWHRAGRSMPVKAWTHRLLEARAATEALPNPGEIKSTAPLSSPPIAPRTAALCSAVLLAVVAGAFTFHNAIGNKSVTPNSAADGTPAAFIAAYDAGSDAASDAESVGAVPAAAGLAASAAAVPGAAAPSANAPHQQAALPPTSRRPAAHHDVAGVYATNATIRHGDHFAEIRVHRRSAAPRDSTFVWWTEGATAKPGVDYVAQEKVTKSFPRGKLSTSFYIKLVPNASRAESAKFYIAIADAGDGSSTGKIDRAAVWLPANHEASEPPG